MLVFGTQMHLITFLFVCIETVIFFYLIIYKLARPDDKAALLNILLILLLIIYNITGGLLPDPKLAGSSFTQEVIAYATGFLTPAYFPYYVYKVFDLEKMKFHAYKGVYLFLVIPYFVFVIAFALSNLNSAENLLILPVLYALWVIYSLFKSVKYKYKNNFNSKDSREEVIVLFASLTPWIGLPIITYFGLNQSVEVSITNTGFLLLLGLQVKRHILRTRAEHQRLVFSEKQLLNWNLDLQEEVDKRTAELKTINEQKANTFVNLVHETKTPLTLVNNYLEEYVEKYGSVEELDIIRNGVNKITRDVTSLFDIERYNKGLAVYNHNQVANFSNILRESMQLFEHYCKRQLISCHSHIEDNIHIKADPNAINRIVNNLIENAIKFSGAHTEVVINLTATTEKIIFSVKDDGPGIPRERQKRIFSPYYQINHEKSSLQGMGLGLPIVKKVCDSLNAPILINSNPAKKKGTEFTINFFRYELSPDDNVMPAREQMPQTDRTFYKEIAESIYSADKQTVLLIEDHQDMLHYLFQKLSNNYNVYCASNGSNALHKLKELTIIPDLILSDIMMDQMDGFAFAKALSEQEIYTHIPIIFLSAKSTRIDKLKSLRSGAIDLITKPFSFEVLDQKIKSILDKISKQKKAVLNATINNLNQLKDSQSKSRKSFEEKCRTFHLTPREIEIINLIHEGYKYKMIAQTLFIAERTVTKHVQHIFQKTGSSNKVELLNKLFE